MNKHEEKHKSDVKENEKKWRNEGICYPKTGDLGSPKKGASPVDALRKTRPNPQHKKWMETEITTLFEQLLQPKLLPCRFISTLI